MSISPHALKTFLPLCLTLLSLAGSTSKADGQASGDLGLGKAPIRPVADLEDQPGSLDLKPSTFVAVDGKAYFVGSGSQVGVEPWRSDGTAAGTYWLADLCPGDCDSRGQILATDGSSLLIGAGSELWLSDGSDSGTVPLATPCSDCRFTSFADGKWNGEVFLFVLREESQGRLWATDGTTEGTRRLDIGGNQVASSLTPGRATYFSALQQGGPYLLFTSDGTATGTRQVAELCADCFFEIQESVELGEKTVFMGYQSDHGLRPWVTDGTAAGTQPLASFSQSGVALPTVDPVVLGDHVIGRLQNICGESCLWLSDGTSEGTRLAPELYPPGSESRFPSKLWVIGDTLYASFVVRDVARQELWLLSGPPGRQLLATADTVRLIGEAGGSLYFNVTRDGSGATWATRGTVETTVQVLDLPSVQVAPVADGALLETRVVGTSGDHETRLWMRAADADAVALGDFDQPLSSSNPGQFQRWRDHLAFTTGTSDSAAKSLWVTDGSQPRALAEERPLTEPVATGDRLYTYDHDVHRLRAFDLDGSDQQLTFDGRFPAELLPWDDRLFVATEVDGQQLWTTQGNPETTELVLDVNPGWTFFCPDLCGRVYFPRFLSRLGDRLLFSAFADSTGPGQLWSTDGSAAGSSVVAEFDDEVFPGGSADSPRDLVSVAEQVFFFAVDPQHGRQLWATDGSAPGTRRLTDSQSLPSGSDLELLVPWGDRVVMVERTDDAERIWWSDGGAPRLIAEFPARSWIRQPVAEGARVYWSAYTPETGRELWFSDGTVAGTRGLDLYPGARGSGADSLTAVADGLFFAADSGNGTGFEPWYLPGDSSEPLQLADVSPGREPSSPGLGERVGDELYFAAANALVGRELFALDLNAVEDLECRQDRLCFFNRRFQVSLRWHTTGGASGDAQRVASQGSSGLFWFFDPGNWESMVKVLDGCAINGHYWVFAATSSDLGFTLTVEDTLTGDSRAWTNPPGRPAPAITEVTAFACSST